MSITDTYSTKFQPLKPVGAHGNESNLSSVVTLTPPATAQALLLQALVQNVRFTLDGTNPTASVGFQLAGEMTLIEITAGMTIKVIQEVSGAVIQYQWVKY